LSKRALVTGITGQDGSYLAEYLLEQGYEVWGMVRGQENPKISATQTLIPDLQLVGGDLLDQGSLISALETVQPDEVYNLGAISFVPVSWSQAELTAEVTGVGVLRMLEAVRIVSGVGRFGAVKTTVRGTYQPYVGDYGGGGPNDIFWYAQGDPDDYLWFGHANRVFTSRATTLDIGYTRNAALRPDSMTSRYNP